jgi:hypothetical protein
MKKKLKRRQGDQGKNKKIKKEIPSQEDERRKPHHLEFNYLTSQPKPKNFLELFLLSV